jgi:hypothetical protein
MATLTLENSPRGILAELPDGLINRELYSAVVDPVCAFLAQIGRQPYFKVPMMMRRNDAQSLELVIQQFMITAVDLGRARVGDFLAWVGRIRAAELLGGELVVSTSRYLIAGLDLGDGVMPFGYVIATTDSAFKNAMIPDQRKTLDPWLMFMQLSLERTMPQQFAEALGFVQGEIGTSMVAALDRGNAPIKQVAAELQRRYRLGPDAAIALMQLGDWHADGGLAKLHTMRAHAATQAGEAER